MSNSSVGLNKRKIDIIIKRKRKKCSECFYRPRCNGSYGSHIKYFPKDKNKEM